MPEEYNKLAEGIVKGTVPMVASFVERYLTEDEPGFFVGDRESIEADIRVHVTVFAFLDRSDPHLPDSTQLGVVDLQQLPEERVWMVVGGLPPVLETENWLNDLYSAMIRRMASRLVQFGFLDAPHRPRLRSASTLALSQVAQVLRPPKPVSAPEPAPATEPPRPVAPAAQAAGPAQPETPAVSSGVSGAPPAAQSAPGRAVPSPASLAATPPSPPPTLHFLNQASGLQLDIVLTVAMVLIWLVACGMLSYLLVLLLR